MQIRHRYHGIIKKNINTPFIKVFTGMRRSGKTYLMRELKDVLLPLQGIDPSQILYIDKEDRVRFDHIKTYTDLIVHAEKYFSTISKKKYLLIDEVQEIENWEHAIRSYGGNNDFDVYITGSNASLLSGELATFLSGRYIEISVHPLTFFEFLDFRRAKNKTLDIRKEFSFFMKYGGLPGIHSTDFSDESIKNYMSGVFDSIVFRDIVSRYQVRNPKILSDLFYFLSDNIGNIFSTQSTIDFLKKEKIDISFPTLKEYLFYFENAFLVNAIKRFDVKGKKILEFFEKYYLEDIGLRSFFLGYESRDVGRVLENIVFLELKARGYSVYIGKITDKEVDFVATKNSITTLIQVAYDITSEETKKRELAPLRSFPLHQKLLLSMNEFEGEVIDDIPHRFVIDWLLEKESG